MKIAHFTCYGSNVGDNALTIGVKKIFNHIIKKETKFNHIFLRNTIFTPAYINKLNQSYDMVIIGGGGLLHSTPSIESNRTYYSGTLIRMTSKDVNLFKIPLIFYGVGFNVFRGEKSLTNIARNTINSFIKKATIFSVRNDGSFERLKKFINNDEMMNKVIEIPDPGFFYDLNQNLTVPTNKVAIQLAFDRINHRLGNVKINDFIKNIRKVINHLHNIGYQVILVPHIKLDDDNIKKYFPKTKKFQYYPKFGQELNTMKFYENCKLVIGMRGHGVICPMGLGVPTLGISTHDKVIGVYKNMDLEEYCYEINELDFSDKFIVLIDQVLSDYNKTKQLFMNIKPKLLIETKEKISI